jgi:lysophospholipase L1-like esterase
MSWKDRTTRFLPKAALGVVVGTPCIAVIQAAALLIEYRINHGNAPRPESPSRGVVVATSSASTFTTAPALHDFYHVATSSWLALRRHRHDDPDTIQSPLRILVIGDSLAAGVGLSRSATPVLPQAIAQSLSQAYHGRVVYWTCVGTPGISATELVQEIYQLDHLPRVASALPARLAQWQETQKRKTQERLEQASRKAQAWWQHRHQRPLRRPTQEPSSVREDDPDANAVQRAMRKLVSWWKRTTNQVRHDWRELKDVIRVDSEDSPDLPTDGEQPVIDDDSQKRPTTTRSARRTNTLVRHNTLATAVDVDEYDIAIVLTGINDLKDAFLPFLMSNERASELARVRQTHNMQEKGIQATFERVVQALQSKMRTVLPGKQNDEIRDKCKEDTGGLRHHGTSHGDERGAKGLFATSESDNSLQVFEPDKIQGPLIVFPAMPLAPLPMSQIPPLCWFLVPIIEAMDRNKQLLAELYPNLVAFVEAPSARVFMDAEAQHGPMWEKTDENGGEREQVLLKLTDIALHAVERVQETMRQHYESWVMDAEDDEWLYVLTEDSVASAKEWEVQRPPGAKLISVDGIHPNDEGYSAWGRIIGQAIVTELEKRRDS